MPIVKQVKTPHGNIRIAQSRDGVVSYYQNGCYHSQANRDGISVCAYIHAIYEMVLQSNAGNVLIVGCAGGSLATMLRRMSCKVTVVDINAAAFTLARDYFKLPADVRCITQDGITYLRRQQKLYDAIILDVFDADNKVPARFTQTSLFTAIREALKENGIMVMNWITRNDRDKRVEKTAQRAQSAGFNIRLFDWPGQTDRNTLILGGGPVKLAIPSGREPEEVEEDMQGLICRALR